jgi:hypothetical protein
VLERARELLEKISENAKTLDVLPSGPAREGKKKRVPSDGEEQILDDIRSLDEERLSPLDALNLLHLWKGLADSGRAVHARRPPPGDAPKHARIIKKDSPGLFDF